MDQINPVALTGPKFFPLQFSKISESMPTLQILPSSFWMDFMQCHVQQLARKAQGRRNLDTFQCKQNIYSTGGGVDKLQLQTLKNNLEKTPNTKPTRKVRL